MTAYDMAMDLLGKSLGDPAVALFLGHYVKPGYQPGQTIKEDSTLIELPEAGLRLVFDHKKGLTMVTFYAKGGEPGVKNFPDTLCENIRLTDERYEVRKKLGCPDSTETSPTRVWDIFKRKNHFLRFEYVKKQDLLRFVSLTAV